MKYLIYVFVITITFSFHPIEFIRGDNQNVYWGLDSLRSSNGLESNEFGNNRDSRTTDEIKIIKFIYKAGGFTKNLNPSVIVGNNEKTVSYAYRFHLPFCEIPMLSGEDTLAIISNCDTTEIQIIRINEGLIFGVLKINSIDKGRIIITHFFVESRVSGLDRAVFAKNSYGGIYNMEIVPCVRKITSKTQGNIFDSNYFASGVIVTPIFGVSAQIDTIPALNIYDCGLRTNKSIGEQKTYYDFRSHDISFGWDEKKKIIPNIFTFITKDGIFLPFVKDGNIIFYLIV